MLDRRPDSTIPEGDVDAEYFKPRERLDSEEELLIYLVKNNFAVLKIYLDKILPLTTGHSVGNIILNIHSKQDACPVCAFLLNDAITNLTEVVKQRMGESCEFFITYSSRQDYNHSGKCRRRLGINASTYKPSITQSILRNIVYKRDEEDKPIYPGKIIFTITDSYKVYSAIEFTELREQLWHTIYTLSPKRWLELRAIKDWDDI